MLGQAPPGPDQQPWLSKLELNQMQQSNGRRTLATKTAETKLKRCSRRVLWYDSHQMWICWSSRKQMTERVKRFPNTTQQSTCLAGWTGDTIASQIDSKDAVANSTNVIPKSVARILAKSMTKLIQQSSWQLGNTNPITNNIFHCVSFAKCSKYNLEAKTLSKLWHCSFSTWCNLDDVKK